MKQCPRCNTSYPDTENFCAVDGTALKAAGSVGMGEPELSGAKEAPQPTQPLSCPSCGGSVEPGEALCSFCGHNLAAFGEPEQTVADIPRSAPTQGAYESAKQTKLQEFDGQFDDEQPEVGGPPSPRRRVFGLVAYTAAALVALAGGAYLAFKLAPSSAPKPVVVEASPSPAPSTAATAGAGPKIILAEEPSAKAEVPPGSTLTEDQVLEAARHLFDINRDALMAKYQAVREGAPNTDDAIWVQLSFDSSGAVVKAAIVASTAPNPDLDARVANAMINWKSDQLRGGNTTVYLPIIFSHDGERLAELQNQLVAKLASLGGEVVAEYQLEKPTSVAARAPSTPIPTPSALSPPSPSAHLPSHHERHEAPPARHARATAPGISRPPVKHPRVIPLLERVKRVLRSDKRFRNVKAYTSGSEVTLYGKVFDEKDKEAVARAVEQIPGVGRVSNTVTTDTSEWARLENVINANLANAGLTNVKAKVIGHDAYLSGTVESDADRNRAVTIVENSAPVTVRTNLINVQPRNILGF